MTLGSNHNNPPEDISGFQDKKLSDRIVKGYAIISKGDIPQEVNQEMFLVPSQSSSRKYVVKVNGGYSCECPDFKYRNKKCKHIYAVEFLLKMRGKLNSEKLDIPSDVVEVKCPYCKSINIKKNGSRKTESRMKQRYCCIDCRKTFVEDKEFSKIKAEPKLATLTMDLYYKGLSLRDISDTIYQFYGLKVSHETIRNWIMRFTKAMNEYTNKFKPKLSDTWHADEQVVKVKGKNMYCWNVLDKDTRFLIASHLGETKSDFDATQTFKKASEVCKRNYRPAKVITDGLDSYNFGVGVLNSFNKGKEVEHISIVGRRKKQNNNLIERYHSTFRERDKVMRGFKTKETTETLAEGFRTYYNFIRQHSGISTTPAKASKIYLGLDRNRWLSLIKKSMENNQA